MNNAAQIIAAIAASLALAFATAEIIPAATSAAHDAHQRAAEKDPR